MTLPAHKTLLADPESETDVKLLREVPTQEVVSGRGALANCLHDVVELLGCGRSRALFDLFGRTRDQPLFSLDLERFIVTSVDPDECEFFFCSFLPEPSTTALCMMPECNRHEALSLGEPSGSSVPVPTSTLQFEFLGD